MMTTGQPQSTDEEAFPDLPWTAFTSIDEVEAWIRLYDQELQACVSKNHAAGHGVRFTLRHGGHIFLHSGAEAILLDVTPEAEWVTPAIVAATGAPPPAAQIWVLPPDMLTQLVLGLNSLIESTQLVASHDYKAKRFPCAR